MIREEHISARFASIDFVEFIFRRDCCRGVIQSLRNVTLFYAIVADVSAHAVTARQAADRLEREMPMPEAGSASWRYDNRLEKNIVFASYASGLPVSDPRHTAVEARGNLWNDEVYRDYVRSSYGERLRIKDKYDDFINGVRFADELDFAVYWVKANQHEFQSILNHKRLIAEIVSTGYFGPDHFSDRIGSVASKLGDLPNLSGWGSKMALILQIAKWLNAGLLTLDYDPSQEFPEIFVENAYRIDDP